MRRAGRSDAWAGGRSGPGEPLDDRAELVEVADEERRDAEALAQLGELLGEPVHLLVDSTTNRSCDPMKMCGESMTSATVSSIPLRSLIAATTFSASPVRSSVTVTGQNEGYTLKVSSSNRSPAACRTQPIFSSVAAQVNDRGSARPPRRIRGARPTVCASRAASSRVVRPPPPMKNGGCGCCTGLGWAS